MKTYNSTDGFISFPSEQTLEGLWYDFLVRKGVIKEDKRLPVIDITMETITPKRRKLKTNWTLDVAQDLSYEMEPQTLQDLWHAFLIKKGIIEDDRTIAKILEREIIKEMDVDTLKWIKDATSNS
jgi:hypothetical protein